MPTSVSIIIPCLNEEKRILKLLDAIFSQTYPHELMDITIADGGSTDHTREVISAFASNHPDLALQVIHNQVGSIPAALNRAITSSKGEVILRLDAHSAPFPDYVQISIEDLLNGKGDNVGGVWEIQPGNNSWMARSIAVAAAHPLGVGDASYRHAQQPALVDTVPFGCYRRTLVEKIGLYNENLLSNEDYEFNTRIRKYGGKVWLDPAIKSIYFARSDLFSLAQQYFRYGFWKFQMLRLYPGTLRWRQALPPVFAVTIFLGLILGIFIKVFANLLILELLVYFGIYLLVAFEQVLKRKDPTLLIGIPLAIFVMHFAWGSGFLSGIFKMNVKS